MSGPLPEHNMTGIDYADRRHFRFAGPIIDFHSHVMRTRPGDPPSGPPLGKGPDASVTQAELMLATGDEFGILQTVTMCPADDIAPLRDRFGDKIAFNAMINKRTLEEPDDEVYRGLDQFLEQGIKIIKFWSAPRGRERGLIVDAPWRIEAARRARSAGVRMVMVHVGDPDTWFRTMYADAAKFGTKPDQYVGLIRLMEMFPDLIFIGAHMGGDVEHPDHLEALLEKYPNLYYDTSATKWQVREVPPRGKEVRSLMCRYPGRFLFGTDLVTRHTLTREHYVSRYWCQRTLWESDWRGPSPIADPDHVAAEGQPVQPPLNGIRLPSDVLEQVYFRNAEQLLNLPVV